MISASSAARLIASIVASTLMMLPLRVPRLAAAPLPMTSSAPCGVLLADQDADLGGPDVAGDEEVLGLGHQRPGVDGDVGRRRGPSSETIPCAVGADEHDSIGKTEIDGPRLPPATLNETARFEQRANLLRSVPPKNSNRPSKDRIHHTETSVGQRGDFRERGKILGRRGAQIFEQTDGFGQSARARRSRARTRSGRLADRRERSGGRPAPSHQRRSPSRVERDRPPLGDADRETVGKSLRRASRARPRDARRAARRAARGRARRGSAVATAREREDLLGPRARCCPRRRTRWSAKSEPPRNRASPTPRARARATRERSRAAALRRRGCRFAADERLRAAAAETSGSSYRAAAPRREVLLAELARRRPPPSSAAGRPGSGARSSRSTTSFLSDT